MHIHSLSLGQLKRFCSQHTFEGCVRRRISSAQVPCRSLLTQVQVYYDTSVDLFLTLLWVSFYTKCAPLHFVCAGGG